MAILTAEFILEHLRSRAEIARKHFVAHESGESPIQHKLALAEIARECGFATWPELKHNIEQWFSTGFDASIYPKKYGAYLHAWFSNQDEAREYWRERGGFLLPYGRHWFVSEAGFVEAIGLDPASPDWELTGRDWTHPQDVRAWVRLAKQLRGTMEMVGRS